MDSIENGKLVYYGKSFWKDYSVEQQSEFIYTRTTKAKGITFYFSGH